MKSIIRKIGWYLGVKRIEENSNTQKSLSIHSFLEQHLFSNQKYLTSKRLNRFEFGVFSQYGEDGILSEILKRIKSTKNSFVEFGAGDGMENNTAALLLQGWSGSWIDGDIESVNLMNKQFSKFKTAKLKTKQAFITKENIKLLFQELEVPNDMGVLSIDIDGNDYWIWKELDNYAADVVVIEYNAALGAVIDWKIDYNAKHNYDGTSYFGASLKSLELLGKSKGYALVGCSFAGTNAFFVKEDLLSDQFHGPYTSEEHFEPQRYFLYNKPGHPMSPKFFE